MKRRRGLSGLALRILVADALDRSPRLQELVKDSGTDSPILITPEHMVAFFDYAVTAIGRGYTPCILLQMPDTPSDSRE
eukprot:SAG31_NODE_30364_length_382_cov_0.798587_1_plen_78_part_01